MSDWQSLTDDLAGQGYVAPPDLAMALHLAVTLPPTRPMCVCVCVCVCVFFFFFFFFCAFPM